MYYILLRNALTQQAPHLPSHLKGDGMAAAAELVNTTHPGSPLLTMRVTKWWVMHTAEVVLHWGGENGGGG